MPAITVQKTKTSPEMKEQRKSSMYARTQELFSTYNNYMIISIKRVKSSQLKGSKIEFDPRVKLLFAKNKIIKKALSDLDVVKYENLIQKLHGDVIFAFYDNVDPKTLLRISEKNSLKANAVAGDVAPKDVIIPAGPTGLDSLLINIFQAAKMNTKINKTKIDLVADHKLLSAGDVVKISDASLLKLLKIQPFEFGLNIVECCENGQVYGKNVLRITEDDITSIFNEVVASIAAVSLGLGISTPASVSYELRNAYADIMAISLATDFPIAEVPN